MNQPTLEAVPLDLPDGFKNAEFFTRAYIGFNGCKCPNCQQDHLIAYEIEPQSGDLAYRDVTCDVCATAWTETFTLTGLNRVEVPRGKEKLCEPLHINEDLENRRKTIEAIKAQDFWGQDETYDRESWKFEVGQSDTQLGYWEWVSHQIEQEYADALQS